MLNKIVIMGRLTRDPELRYTQSQTPVASFTVAVPCSRKMPYRMASIPGIRRPGPGNTAQTRRIEHVCL